VPAIEARDAGGLVGGRDGRLVEGGVGGMLEGCALEALVVVDGAAVPLPMSCTWGTRGMDLMC
jgi:hypothetical protein